MINMMILELCTITYCILCVRIPSVVSTPLSKTTNLDTSPSKYMLSSINNLYKNKAGGSKSTEPAKKKVLPLEDYEDDSSEYGSGDFDPLAAITNKILSHKPFSPNASDGQTDNIVFPPPQRLVAPEEPSHAASALIGLSLMEMHERAKVMRISEVKQSILSKLRLFAPPNITALKMSNKLKKFPDHIVPKFAEESLDIQQDQAPQYDDNYHAKISTTIQFATSCKFQFSYYII